MVTLRDGTVAVDVTVAHPAAGRYRDLTTPGEAAAAVEATKIADSAALCASVGCAFSPFALESWGAVGPKSYAFLARVAAERLPSAFVRSWVRHVVGACQLAYIDAFGNAFAAAQFLLSSVVFPVLASSVSSAVPVGSPVASASSALPTSAPSAPLADDEILAADGPGPASSSLVLSPCRAEEDDASFVSPDPCVFSFACVSSNHPHPPEATAASLSSSRVSTSPPPPFSPRSVVTSPPSRM